MLLGLLHFTTSSRTCRSAKKLSITAHPNLWSALLLMYTAEIQLTKMSLLLMSFRFTLGLHCPLSSWPAIHWTSALTTCVNKKPSCCWQSRSNGVLWNSRAACWRWLFQTWKIWLFACSQYVFNLFARCHQRPWFKDNGVWELMVDVGVESCKIVFLGGQFLLYTTLFVKTWQKIKRKEKVT